MRFKGRLSCRSQIFCLLLTATCRKRKAPHSITRLCETFNAYGLQPRCLSRGAQFSHLVHTESFLRLAALQSYQALTTCDHLPVDQAVSHCCNRSADGRPMTFSALGLSSCCLGCLIWYMWICIVKHIVQSMQPVETSAIASQGL